MEDILGLKPYGEAIHTVAKKAFEGVEVFLSSTCKPALDELGLMLRDHVRVWRLNNALKIVEKAKGKFSFSDDQVQLQSNPKVALAILENGSNEDNDEIQEMWAGLFATSFSVDGKDDENLMYVSILRQLTLAEAKLLKYMCESSKKRNLGNHILATDLFTVDGDTLREVTGIEDYNQLDTILYHLGSLKLSELRQGISHGGFRSASFNEKPLAWFQPTNLALYLYLRCIGNPGTPEQYWSVEESK